MASGPDAESGEIAGSCDAESGDLEPRRPMSDGNVPHRSAPGTLGVSGLGRTEASFKGLQTSRYLA
jgi:hypothetical protein